MSLDYVSPFFEGLAVVQEHGENKFIDVTGKTVITLDPRFSIPDHFSEGLAAVTAYSKTGFIDKTGKKVIDVAYSEVRNFSEGLAAVNSGVTFRPWLYIDKTGRDAIPFNYDDAYSFSEGLAAIKKDGKFGFIDKKGNIVIACIYDKLLSGFFDGHAKLIKDGLFYYIDKTGKNLTPEW
jgi:hypothetical protein